MPHGHELSRTLLFLSASASQLLLAYSARRIMTAPRSNIALQLTVVLSIGLLLLGI